MASASEDWNGTTRTLSGTSEYANPFSFRRGHTFSVFEPTLQPIKQIEQLFFRSNTHISECGKVKYY